MEDQTDAGSTFRKGSLRAGAKPKITDSLYVCLYIRVCLDRNRHPQMNERTDYR